MFRTRIKYLYEMKVCSQFQLNIGETYFLSQAWHNSERGRMVKKNYNSQQHCLEALPGYNFFSVCKDGECSFL